MCEDVVFHKADCEIGLIVVEGIGKYRRARKAAADPCAIEFFLGKIGINKLYSKFPGNFFCIPVPTVGSLREVETADCLVGRGCQIVLMIAGA